VGRMTYRNMRSAGARKMRVSALRAVKPSA